MIEIGNNGSEITYTNYWDSEHARCGFCYLSANAGVWRLLVPPEGEVMLAEMKTGRSVSIEPSLHEPGRCWDVVFNDGSDAPFFVAVDKQQVDRAMLQRLCRLTVWTRRGKELDLSCEVNT
ncbi:hypothetical protein BLL52_4135 [Rhodoferax antarcticus ANT.BR]|uniref:Uncharacterized protein n=2 Tax=Rhodoferax antarcticus TaxID=81479 RepID=A0A1Q8Y9B9_9BURK|nr:hypothetical protein BLL52_4135 [Rhodoferax antarcticus ANT.BR]